MRKAKIDKDGEFVRGNILPPVCGVDREVFKAEIEKINAKSVLEFGPGDSTQLFLDLGIGRIVTCEHKDRWLKEAQKRFSADDRVRVIKYTDTDPVEADLGGEKFDLALVDSPQGYRPMRVAIPGMEDCNRLNTCLFALKHAKVVLLHDATRPLERGSLGRLNRMGYKWEYISFTDTVGIARIESREFQQDQPDPQSVTQSGGAPAGAKPKRRRSRVNGRPDRLGAGGPEKKKRGGRSAVVVNSDDSDGAASSSGTHSSECSTFGVWGGERDGTICPSPTGGADANQPT